MTDRRPRREVPVGIVGGGAWGTALAWRLACNGASATILSRDPARISVDRGRLAGSLAATADARDLAKAQTVAVAVRAQAVRPTLARIAPNLRADAAIVICAKGIELGGTLLSDVARATIPGAALAVLSGPGFAVDVFAERHVGLALAAEDVGVGRRLRRLFEAPAFRVYETDDLVGVQLGGAFKNVVALACGIAAGAGLGESARAAALTLGFEEFHRIGMALGARSATLLGPSGLGDLALSCMSSESRNYACGAAIGEGGNPEEAARGGLAEGIETAGASLQLCAELAIDAPLCAAVVAVVRDGAPPVRTLSSLLGDWSG